MQRSLLPSTLFNPDHSLLEEVPFNQAHHNIYPPLHSPLFTPSELPSPSSTVTETEHSQLFTTPPLIPTQNSQLANPYPILSIPQPISTTVTMATSYTMPMHNECTAPTFNSSKPRELSRYFEDLEQLMRQAAITSEEEKKQQVLCYVDFNTEQIWKTFPKFIDNNKTYNDFKDAILVHYPDALGDFIYSIRDMDLLIGKQQHVGITSTQDLSDYHLQFIAITTWLISKVQLGNLEQQRAYIQAFQPSLLNAIINRLQLKNPDHHPNGPHKVKEVYEAARFVLQGYTSFTQNLIASNSPQQSQQPQSPSNSPVDSTNTPVEAEDLSALFARFTKSIIEALQSTQHRGQPHANHSHTGKLECNYCGEEHFICDCPHVPHDIATGKCKRNQDGKVVLPSGAYVPRDITGKFLCNCINKWHKKNPNQLGAATLIHMIDKHILDEQKSPNSSVYQLTATNHIAVLEAELYNL